MKSFIITLTLLTAILVNAQEVLVDEIQTQTGSMYFSDTESSQPSLVIQKPFDFVLWAPVSMSDTLPFKAYRKNNLFTGTVVDKDTAGNVIATYQFVEGSIVKLQEFFDFGKPSKDYNYWNGIPDGMQRDFGWDGELTYMETYEKGVLNGEFYYSTDRGDSGLPPCFKEGVARNGVLTISRDTCAE
jgi:hypothetical protein